MRDGADAAARGLPPGSCDPSLAVEGRYAAAYRNGWEHAYVAATRQASALDGGTTGPAGLPAGLSSRTDGGQMEGLAVPGGNLPARTGEVYSYGSWQRATGDDGELLDQLGLCLEHMLSDLTAVNAGRTQVRQVTNYADRVRAEAGAIRQTIAAMDSRYQPVIAAVGAAGGPDEVCDTRYYEDI